MASTLNEIMGRMNDLEHQDVETDLFAHLYGGIGVGKTTLAAWLAQMLRGDGDILHIDSSDGWVSLRNTPALMDGIYRIEVTDAGDLSTIGDALEKRKTGFENYTVAIIDEGSSLAQDVLEQSVRKATGTPSDQPLPEIEGKHYGPQLAAYTAIMKKFKRTQGLHVIWVSHDKEKSVQGRVDKIFPQYPPLLGKEIQKISHICAYVSASLLADGSYNRQVQSLPSRLIEAKSRIGDMPVITDMQTWIDKVYDWVAGDMAADLTAPEPEVTLVDDVLTDRPRGDDPTAYADDEPIIAEGD